MLNRSILHNVETNLQTQLRTFIGMLIVSVFLFTSCTTSKTEAPSVILPTTVTVQQDAFVDNVGRQVLLNGINVVSKSKEEGYIFKGGPELYQNLKKWGVNCIRFIIIWDRLEPEPGVYDENYLKEIDERIAWAKENNIFIVLDMHQDLYSVKYSDGAPKWATLDEGKPHATGAIWSDSYMLSEAVQTSFDNFWLNKPASDGVGIQDHYAALWKHIAARYANNTTVIGYDIMNEPFPGSTGIQSTYILLKAYGELHYNLTGEVLSEIQLMQMWENQKSRIKALEVLSNQKNYDFVFSQLFELNKDFETNQLQSMYQKVSNAIRAVDTKHILFLEHSYFGNTGVQSSIERVLLPNGSPDPLVAYAPHGYDLVTDTEAVASASNERVSYIYNQIKKKGAQLKMPIWLGEWGAFYGSSKSIIPVAKDAIALIEKNNFGNAYWSYNPGTENLDYFKNILVRAYPAYINGKLLHYQNNFDEGTFTMEWQEDKFNKSPSVVFIPHLSQLNKNEIARFSLQKIKDSDAGYLILPTNKNDNVRKLTLTIKK